jgi:D-alanine-D-alanine ligase
MKVAVLKGGISAERDVSLVSGAACATALRQEGFDVVEIDARPETLEADLSEARPDVAFNALHGDWGEDGGAQSILEKLKLPYTHSSIAASRMAMNKDFAKEVLALHGITVPLGGTAPRAAIARGGLIPVPYVVKPNGSGSSASVHIVKIETADVLSAIRDDAGLGDFPIIERFIPGRELTVSVVKDEAVCVTEIVPAEGWYDYEAKYAAGGSRHILPANIPECVTALAMEWAVEAHFALGCAGATRSDFRFDDEGLPENPSRDDVVNRIVMLELNTQPGMTPTSLVPEQCAHKGMSFEALCRWMVEDASWPRRAQKRQK